MYCRSRYNRGRRDRVRMVVGFTTTCAIFFFFFQIQCILQFEDYRTYAGQETKYIIEKERKGAQCICRRMEKAPKIGRQFPCSGQ